MNPHLQQQQQQQQQKRCCNNSHASSLSSSLTSSWGYTVSNNKYRLDGDRAPSAGSRGSNKRPPPPPGPPFNNLFFPSSHMDLNLMIDEDPVVTTQPRPSDGADAARSALERRAAQAAMQLRHSDRAVLRQVQCGLCLATVTVVSGAFYIYFGIMK